MRLVLDTNIFISAFYWEGNSQKVIDRIIVGSDDLYVSDKILEEISEVMARPKFNTEQETIDQYIKTIEENCKKVFTEGRIKGICRDKDDDDKLECGLICDADYIITGDDDLLILGNYEMIKIITPKEYLVILDNIFPDKK
jgi:putative PIN family toxin of toxin-antitoxin system